MHDYSEFIHGSAQEAEPSDLRRAGLHEREGAYIGHDNTGRPCFAAGQSAILLNGPARSLKGSLVIPWLVDGVIGDRNGPHHVFALDMKRQDTVVGALQVSQGRHCYYLNLRRAPGLPFHRANALEHFVPNSPELVGFSLLMAKNWIANTNSHAAYFEEMAQKILAACLVTYTREYGHATLPGLADKMAGLGSSSEEWLSFEFAISQQPEPQIREVATMLQELGTRKNLPDKIGL